MKYSKFILDAVRNGNRQQEVETVFNTRKELSLAIRTICKLGLVKVIEDKHTYWPYSVYLNGGFEPTDLVFAYSPATLHCAAWGLDLRMNLDPIILAAIDRHRWLESEDE